MRYLASNLQNLWDKWFSTLPISMSAAHEGSEGDTYFTDIRKIYNLTINRDHSYWDKETRAVTYTNRHSRVHLIRGASQRLPLFSFVPHFFLHYHKGNDLQYARHGLVATFLAETFLTLFFAWNITRVWNGYDWGIITCLLFTDR